MRILNGTASQVLLRAENSIPSEVFFSFVICLAKHVCLVHREIDVSKALDSKMEFYKQLASNAREPEARAVRIL